MKALTLERFAWTTDGVFGRLGIEGVETVWRTVENPWLGNLPCISCIPAGTYRLELGTFYNGDKPDYAAYEVMSVPNRSHIKLHVGNVCDNTIGCICVAERRGFVKGRWAVIHSQRGFAAFMNAMGGDKKATLWISNLVPGG